jgi:hypothetical protein
MTKFLVDYYATTQAVVVCIAMCNAGRSQCDGRYQLCIDQKSVDGDAARLVYDVAEPSIQTKNSVIRAIYVLKLVLPPVHMYSFTPMGSGTMCGQMAGCSRLHMPASR